MTIKPVLATVLVVVAPMVCPATGHADDTTHACVPAQLVVSALPTQAGVSHRGVPLVFALAPGASPCTLTGYPGVDSGAGGPLLHATRTLRGYLGGLPSGVDIPPTVTVRPGHPAQAMVEGIAVDADTDQCPTYTDLLVTAPDTTGTVTVPATIDTCQLAVHPVTSA